MLKLRPATRGSIWMLTGFVACPCHLAVTMPILLGATAGTALGAFLGSNVWLLGAASTMYFLLAVVFGLRSLRQGRQSHAAGAMPANDLEFACCRLDEIPQRAKQ